MLESLAEALKIFLEKHLIPTVISLTNTLSATMRLMRNYIDRVRRSARRNESYLWKKFGYWYWLV